MQNYSYRQAVVYHQAIVNRHAVNQQVIANQRNLIRQTICATALYLAGEAVRKGELSFRYMGKLFRLTAISEQEYYVTHNGRDAGIRVYEGVAEFA